MYHCKNGHVFGEYAFDGICIPSSSVQTSLPPLDLHFIRKEVKRITKNHLVDYTLIFENEEGSRILAIDNISQPDKKDMIDAKFSSEFIARHNYYTLVYDH